VTTLINTSEVASCFEQAPLSLITTELNFPQHGKLRDWGLDDTQVENSSQIKMVSPCRSPLPPSHRLGVIGDEPVASAVAVLVELAVMEGADATSRLDKDEGSSAK
jgi:hypothetical protein